MRREHPGLLANAMPPLRLPQASTELKQTDEIWRHDSNAATEIPSITRKRKILKKELFVWWSFIVRPDTLLLLLHDRSFITEGVLAFWWKYFFLFSQHKFFCRINTTGSTYYHYVRQLPVKFFLCGGRRCVFWKTNLKLVSAAMNCMRCMTVCILVCIIHPQYSTVVSTYGFSVGHAVVVVTRFSKFIRLRSENWEPR